MYVGDRSDREERRVIGCSCDGKKFAVHPFISLSFLHTGSKSKSHDNAQTEDDQHDSWSSDLGILYVCQVQCHDYSLYHTLCIM